MPDIVVTGAAEATDSVQKFGYALFHGLLTKAQASKLRAAAERVYEASELDGGHPLMANFDYNTADLRAMDGMSRRYAAVHAVLATPLRETFDRMLGPNWVISLDESPVFKSNGNKSRKVVPTSWHQDARVNSYDTALCWIALSPCGVDAPGLKLLTAGIDGPIEPFTVDRADPEKEGILIKRYGADKIAAPAFHPGDALVFNRYSTHSTYTTPDMINDRLSFKITGVARADAHRVTRPLDPKTLGRRWMDAVWETASNVLATRS
jgi:hypothetical protein